jgi:modification methylase
LIGHAADVLSGFPDGCVDCIITSPTYYNAVSYNGGAPPWASYGAYIEGTMTVLRQCARLLRPNRKLCLNTMAMPIPQDVFRQNTRRIENIPADFYHAIITGTDLRFYDEYVWRKQTSKAMFGSRHRPGNLLANNTTERITVYVKPGKTPKFAPEVQAANWIPDDERLDLIQQIWNMHPVDVKREKGHPSPFPQKLLARLIRMFTYGAVGDFPGEIILDPFCGTGTTCAVAKRMGRRFIGIDSSTEYVDLARKRVDAAVVGDWPMLFIGRPKYPGKDELAAPPAAAVRLDAVRGKAKHHRKSYGRGARDAEDSALIERMETERNVQPIEADDCFGGDALFDRL